jgi:hypothetical protein
MTLEFNLIIPLRCWTGANLFSEPYTLVDTVNPLYLSYRMTSPGLE